MLLIVLTAYALLTAAVYRFWLTRGNERYPLHWEMAALAPVLLLQGILVLTPMLGQHLFVSGFGHMLNLLAWLMVLMYWSGSFYFRLNGLQLMLFPMVLLCLLMGWLFPGGNARTAMTPLFTVHITVSVLAYCLFGLAALLAVLLILLTRALHKHRFTRLMAFLPPLLSMEKLMFLAVQIGFALLTVSLFTGLVFAEQIFGHALRFSHKTVFGMTAWVMYALLLFSHYRYAWRGKKAAAWTIAGFIAVMLAYVGSKFVLEVLLHRPQLY